MRLRWFAAGLASLVLAAPAEATTWTVTGTGDTGGSCDASTCTTLRGALAEAAKVSGPDTIKLPAGTYRLSNGQLAVTSEVQLDGASAATTSVVGDGKSFRIFNVGADQKATITHLTIANGAATAAADGIGGNVQVNNGATLVLDHVRLTQGNALRGGGLGMRTGSSVTITRSLLDTNNASNDGGALLSLGAAGAPGNVLRMSDSTVAANTALSGAGIVLSGNPNNATALDRVTIARNPAGTNSLGRRRVRRRRRVGEDRRLDHRGQHRRRRADQLRRQAHDDRRQHRGRVALRVRRR